MTPIFLRKFSSFCIFEIFLEKSIFSVERRKVEIYSFLFNLKYGAEANICQSIEIFR